MCGYAPRTQKTVCARGTRVALLGGPSTSPLEGLIREITPRRLRFAAFEDSSFPRRTPGRLPVLFNSVPKADEKGCGGAPLRKRYDQCWQLR